MEVRHLEYFVAVVDAGGFSAAATRCGVAQPSLSQQIAKLEQELGVRLFDRLGRQVALTTAGEALLPRARSVLEAMQLARTCVGDDAEAGRGRLTVGAIPTIAPMVLPRWIKRFLKEHPEAELHVREDLTEHLIADLRNAELDMAFMSLPIEDDRIEFEQLFVEPMLACVSRDHPLAEAKSVRVTDLEREPAIVLDEMHCFGEQVDAFCRERRISRRIVCKGVQLDFLKALVDLGLGVSIVPEMCMHADQTKKRAYLPLAGRALSRAVVVAWRSGRTRSALAEAFLNGARAEIAQTQAEHAK